MYDQLGSIFVIRPFRSAPLDFLIIFAFVVQVCFTNNWSFCAHRQISIRDKIERINKRKSCWVIERGVKIILKKIFKNIQISLLKKLCESLGCSKYCMILFLFWCYESFSCSKIFFFSDVSWETGVMMKDEMMVQ